MSRKSLFLPEKSMKYLEFTFHTLPCTETVNDVLAAVLGDIGFESFTEAEEGIKAYIQEKLFGELLEHASKLQDQITTTNKVIIYKVNQESGLGNVIVGLVSSFVAAVASNRGIQSIFYSLIDDS